MDCVSSLEFYTGVTGTGSSSGMDLYVPEDIVIPAGQTVFIDHQIKAMYTTGPNSSHVYGLWLLPRSSMSKTPLRMANSIGLIDPDYRGNIIAAITNTGSEDYSVARGTRLVQLALPTLVPFSVTWKQSLHAAASARGDGGFGSTGV